MLCPLPSWVTAKVYASRNLIMDVGITGSRPVTSCIAKLLLGTVATVCSYGTGHMQCHTHRQAPASMRTKWVSHCTTLLGHVLTRACMLLSFTLAIVRRVVKNLLKHNKSLPWPSCTRGPPPLILLM